MEKKEKEQKLLKMWMTHKYWASCCEDEAIDWCNHPDAKLESAEEVAEYVEWRAKVKSLCTQLKDKVEARFFSDLAEIF